MPSCFTGVSYNSPLWKRGVGGDFIINSNTPSALGTIFLSFSSNASNIITDEDFLSEGAGSGKTQKVSVSG